MHKMIVSRFILTFLLMLAVAPAAAANWAVDAGKSQLGFTGSQEGKPFSGQFKTWSGQIAFDAAHPEACAIAISINMASAKTGDTQKDASLPEAAWFDVKQFPQAKFTANKCVAKGGKNYEAAGTLTIRGISAPVTLPFALEIKDKQAHATGQLGLIRTDYGVGQGEWATDSFVALTVAVTLDIAANSQ